MESLPLDTSISADSTTTESSTPRQLEEVHAPTVLQPTTIETEPETSGSEDEESDDENDSEDEEPILKYQRLSGTLAESLKKDAVSTMAISDRFLALGTHWGVVHILDLNGNNVKKFECHSATVNDISIDTTGEFVASASDDGKIIINSLYTPEVQTFKHRRPIKCVALEPEYSRKPSRNHVSGGTGEELILTGKGWFSSFDTVIGSGEGAVWAVSWRNENIAWANDAGVKLYDTGGSQKFAYIDRPAGSPRAELFRPNLCWKNDETIMIGWADSVKIGVIKEREKQEVVVGSTGATVGLPSKYVEIITEFQTDFIVSGIAPIRNDIVLLSFITNFDDFRNIDVMDAADSSKSRLVSNPPEIHVVDMNGEHVANDVLSLFGFEHYRANDYRLAFVSGMVSPVDATFYIVSPKDIVVAKPRDTDDHIEFLLSKARYEEALIAVEKAAMSKKETDGTTYQGRMGVADVVHIGLKYLSSLMDDGKYEKAVATMPKILRVDPKLWEQWIYIFIGIDKLTLILPKIPFDEISMNKAVYEMMLSRFLETDQKTFVELIKGWPNAYYDTEIVADGVDEVLKADMTNKQLLDAAVDLCIKCQRFDRALLYGLHLQRPGILQLVAPHNLFHVLESRIDLVMAYDMAKAVHEEDIFGSLHWTGGSEGYGERTGEIIDESVRVVRRAGIQDGVKLLVANTDRVPPLSIVKQLSSRKSLHIYLDALFRSLNSNDGVQFHTLQIELYADFDPSRLLDFLRQSSNYKPQSAYELCEIRDLVPEMVYLLGKMGDNRKALFLVIERLGDVKQAIEFAKEQNDVQLWDDLIKYSMDKPQFIIGLLENLGSHIDPIKLIKGIPEGLEIPNLRASLIKIMTDYAIQMSLREGCSRILVSDAVKLMEALYTTQRKALIFDENGLKCDLCDAEFSMAGPDKQIVIYFCKHTFHKSCIMTKLVGVGRSITDSPEQFIRQSGQPIDNDEISLGQPYATNITEALKMINNLHSFTGNAGMGIICRDREIRSEAPYGEREEDERAYEKEYIEDKRTAREGKERMRVMCPMCRV